MDEKRFLLIAEIVESRFYRSQNIVRLKAYDIMQKAAKFISFRFNFDWWASISLNIFNMHANFIFEILHVVFELSYYVFLLQNFKMLLSLIQFDQVLNSLINAILESFQLV